MIENKYGAPGSIESTVLQAVSIFPVEKFKTWVSAYFRPAAVFAVESSNASLGGAAKNLAVAGVIAGVVVGVATILSAMLSINPGGLITGAIALVVMAVLYPVLLVLGGFLCSGVYFVFAKLLGGKGTYATQTYTLALVMGGSILLSAPFQLLGAIPLVGLIFSFGSALVSIYSLYSEYRVIKEVHQLSSGKAIAVILLPIAIAIVVMIILVVILGAMFFTMIAGAASMAKP